MSVQTDPYSFVNGTVADALQVNARFNPLYTLQNGGIDSANMNLTGSFAWTGQHSFTGIDAGTSVTSTTANVGSVIIRNTNTTVNNFQSVDFKNDTGAIVGRIACVNADHTAASEDTKLSIVGMLAGVLKEFVSVNNASVLLGANNLVISDGAQSTDQGMAIYTANNKTGYYGFTDNGSALQGWIAYDHTNEYITIGSSGVNQLTIGANIGLYHQLGDATTTLTSNWLSSLTLVNSNSTVNAGSAIQMNNSSGVMMGKIACVNLDNTGGSEDSRLEFLLRNAGTLASVVKIHGNGELELPNIDPPTANYGNRNGFMKAWCRATGAGTVNASYNIDAVTHTATGIFDITFDTDFSGASTYGVSTSSIFGATPDTTVAMDSAVASTAAGFRLKVYDITGSALADRGFSFDAFGTQ